MQVLPNNAFQAPANRPPRMNGRVFGGVAFVPGREVFCQRGSAGGPDARLQCSR